MADRYFSSHAKAHLSRRLFFQALGLGLSAPLAYRLVQSATAQTGGKPKRFLLYYIPHGMPPEHFVPTGQPDNFTLSSSGESILGSLEPYKNLINIYQGFKYPGAETHEGILKFLSGVALENSDETTPRTSIEHFIANEMGVSALALGALPNQGFGLEKDGKLMWDGQAVAAQPNPIKAYDEVFGSLGSAPADPTPQGPSVDQELHNALLTLTEKDISNLQGSLGDLTSEKTKLQTHLEAISALKSTNSGGPIVSSCTTAPQLAALDALRSEPGANADDFYFAHENLDSILTAHLEVAAAALVCNSRPVVGIQNLFANCNIEMEFVGQGVSGQHHGELSHIGPQALGGNSATLDLSPRAPFAIAQRWFVDKLVNHLIAALDVPDPADPGSTVLENTIVLLCSEIGEGAWHTSWTSEILLSAPPGTICHMPIITIGGAGGGLKTGQVLNYNNMGTDVSTDNPNDRPSADVWLTLARAMGSSAMSFGDSSTLVTEALA